MSIEATNWAWKQAVKSSTKLVLLALADRANADGKSWPSIARVATETGMDKRSVYRHIRQLVDDGLVTVLPDNGRGNSYLLHLSGKDQPVTDCQGNPCHNVTRDKLSPVTDCQETPDKNDTVPLTKTTNPSTKEPKEEPSKNPKKNTRAREQKTPKLAFGQFGMVNLTQAEHDKLMEEHGERGRKAVEKLDSWLAAKGKDPYKSHYAAFTAWVFRAVDEDEAKTARASPIPHNRNGPPTATTQYQKSQQDKENMATLALRMRQEIQNGNERADCDGINLDGCALPAGVDRGSPEGIVRVVGGAVQPDPGR
jgi:hypothetical protein